MQHTTNYNLNKPDVEDRADINDLNENMDIIDSALTDKVGDVSFVNFNHEGDLGVKRAGTLVVDGVGTPVFTSDSTVLQFDIARDDKARGILFSTSSSADDVECNGVYKAQSHLSYNLDESVLKLTSLAANYNHISITPSDIQLSGHPAGGTWDGTNASLVSALTDKLSKTGGTTSGTIITSGSSDDYKAIYPDQDRTGWIGMGPARFARIYSVSFYGDLEGGIRQLVSNRDDADYPLIFSSSSSDQQVTAEVRKDSQIKFNPENCSLVIGGVTQRTSTNINQDGVEHHVDVGVAAGSEEEYVDTWSQLTYEDVVLHSEDSTLSPNTWDGTNTSLKSALTAARYSVKTEQLDPDSTEWRPVVFKGATSIGPLSSATLTYRASTNQLKNSDGTNTLSVLTTDVTLNTGWFNGQQSLKSALSDVSYYSSQSVLQEEDTSTVGLFEVILSGSNQATSRTESVRKANNLRYSPSMNLLSIAGENNSEIIISGDDGTHSDGIWYNTSRGVQYLFQDSGTINIWGSNGEDSASISPVQIDCGFTQNNVSKGIAMSAITEDITIVDTTWDGTHNSLKDAIVAASGGSPAPVIASDWIYYEFTNTVTGSTIPAGEMLFMNFSIDKTNVGAYGDLTNTKMFVQGCRVSSVVNNTPVQIFGSVTGVTELSGSMEVGIACFNPRSDTLNDLTFGVTVTFVDPT